MTLDFQLQQVPFTYGLAEGTDPHAVPFGVLTRLENFRWQKHARVEKRYGVTALGEVVNASRLFVRGEELCAINGTSLLSRDASSGAWTTVASVPDVGLTTSPLLDMLSGVQASDTAVSGNFIVTGFLKGDPTAPAAAGVMVTVRNVNGAVLMPATVVASAAVAYGIRVIVIGTTAILVASGADANIRAWTVDLTTFLVGGAATILANNRDNATFQNWDARLLVGSSLFILAYEQAAGGTVLTSYDVTLVAQATSTEAGVPSPTKLAIAGTSGESICVVGFSNVSDVAAYIADATTMVTSAGPTVLDGSGTVVTQVGVCRYDATTYAIVYTRNPAVGATTVQSVNSKMFDSTATIVANSKRVTSGCALVSNPFVVNGKCYVFGLVAAAAGTTTATAAPFTGNASVLLGVYPGPDDGTSAATDLTHQFLGSTDILLGAYSSLRSCLPVLLEPSSTKSVGAVPYVGTVPNNQFTWRCALRLVTVAAGADAPSDLWRSVSVGAETYFAGSPLSVYDGGDVFDHGFVYAPTLATLSTAGAGAIATGNYIYATHGEYRGSSGLVFRGPTMVAPALAVGALATNTLRLVNVNVGNKKHLQVERASSSLPIYRSIVNGTVTHRLTEDPTYNLSPLDYAAVFQSFVDARNDSAIDTSSVPPTLASRPALYTSGGILDDYQAPANHTMFGHVDRLFVLACDKRRWWFSKTFQDDLGVAPGFHPDNTIAFEEDQTCGGSLDDKAIFFSENRISYTIGFGPGPSGQGGEVEFTTPIKLQTDAGCTQPRGLVSTPDGLMYRSPLGIHLLTRGLEVQWIGRSVQDDLDAFPTVTSATLVPYASEIRFTCTDGEHGIVLVYNYVEKQWSTSKYIQDADGNGVAIVDACMHAGRWTFVTLAGEVYKEDTTTYLDDGAYVPDAIETAWISAGGPVTYQSVRNFYLLGRSHTDHTLRIECAFDSEDAFVQSRVFPARSGVTEVSEMEDVQISIGTRRKCSSIRFHITSSAPTALGSVLGIGQGPSFETMGIEVGVKKGSPTPANRKG